MIELLQGKFIVLDGPDGCGKSTQARMLTQWLTDNGVTVETFRDPGDTVIGEKIREILLDPVHETMSDRTELMLYMASRAQLWHEKIAPALQRGSCVLLDRWLSSTCAYQGSAGGLGMDRIIKIAADCLERTWPDLTIILDISPEDAANRLDRELDRMEQKSIEYHRKVQKGFQELAAQQDTFAILDASEPIKTVHEQLLQAVIDKICH